MVPRMPPRIVAPALALAALAAGAPSALALPAGWDAPVPLSSTKVAALQPWSAADSSGDAVVAWRARRAGREVVQVAFHRAGTPAWTAPVTLGPSVTSVQGVRVAIADSGRTAVGWRTKNGRVVVARAAVFPAPGATPRRYLLGPASDASGPVNVAVAGTGVTAVVWTAVGPKSVNDPARRLGRARLVAIGKTLVARPAVLLDRNTRPGEGFCADDSRPDVRAGFDGRILAWWDCSDDIRDTTTQFQRLTAAGAPGVLEVTGDLSRGPTRAALADAGSGAVVGLFSEFNDFEAGSQLRRIARSAAGAWKDGIVTQAGVTPDDFDAPIAGSPPVLAREPGGTTLGAWVGGDDAVAVVTAAASGANPFAPAQAVGPAGFDVQLAGAGVTTSRSMFVVWSARTAPPAGQERTIWSVLRVAGDLAFPAPVDSLRVPVLVGVPTVALGADGRGVLAFSQGPKATASVRASVLALP